MLVRRIHSRQLKVDLRPPDTVHMPLAQLSYVSRPAADTNIEQARELVRGAAARNKHLWVTGLLVFRSDLFCQVLEGERSVISALFQKIAKDDRHTDVELVGLECVGRRGFPSWSMGYLSLHEAVRKTVLEFSATGEPDLANMRHEDLVQLLVSLTRKESAERTTTLAELN